ncbi:hypothetical protein [Cellulomonas composti]|uniref:Uncharacterized protein n=1 Tax=Cellulomonas composti TaxID=266130 RepID=A0A511JCH3_9CELL|nr:hypothetical protein [Cellulomonas composti]GEL95701.1 hypothetical protein CCO02nite_23590 [Cellulomonas composti]
MSWKRLTARTAAIAAATALIVPLAAGAASASTKSGSTSCASQPNKAVLTYAYAYGSQRHVQDAVALHLDRTFTPSDARVLTYASLKGTYYGTWSVTANSPSAWGATCSN